MTPTVILDITSFDIVQRDAGTYAYICADVEVSVDTIYAEPMFLPTACEAMVLLSDDTDLTALQNAAEQWELAEDVSLWDRIDDY